PGRPSDLRPRSVPETGWPGPDGLESHPLREEPALRTQAIVPIKSFGAAKQRLADVLATGSRRSLVQAMFSDVLASLRRCSRVDAIAVVTADPIADSIARSDRVPVLHDDAHAGQSAAV